MFALSRFQSLICLVATLALPGAALPVEEPSAQGSSASAARETPSTASAGAVQNLPESPMQRIQQIVVRIKQDLEEVESPPAWHVEPGENVQTIVLIPAKKLDRHVEEISKLAEEFGKRMKERHPAVLTPRKKDGAPQTGAIAACEKGLAEIRKLISGLRCDASWMLVHIGKIEIKYYFDIDRLERTLARISALAQLCDQSIRGVKETAAETKKPGKYQQLAGLKRQAHEVQQELEQIKAQIAEIENEE